MPKVTFIIDGETSVVDFEHGEVPYSHHGKPESFLDIAKHFGVPLDLAVLCAVTAGALALGGYLFSRIQV